jgi:hypothetical protein
MKQATIKLKISNKFLKDLNFFKYGRSKVTGKKKFPLTFEDS